MNGKKKWLCRAMVCSVSIVWFLCVMVGSACALPTIGAQAYALMEADSGRMLLSERGEEKLPMASTTKVMTCIVAIENGQLDEIVQVPDEAVGIEGSSIYLQYGETMTMEDLLYGLMLASGNDAAVAIAIHIAGSVENFADMMNQKAAEIGAFNTHFVTPNGLPAEGHYTTACDLARISAYAMQNEVFRNIVGTASRDLAQDDDSPARYLRSKNKILYQYEGGNGVKTGYTKAAGKCLTAGASREGMQMIAVVLNDSNMFEDCYDLLDYGFSEYDLYELCEEGKSMGLLPVQEGIEKGVEIAINCGIALPLQAEEYKIIEKKVHIVSQVQAPVHRGMVVGSVDFCLNGEPIATAEIIATADVLKNTYGYHFEKIMEKWIG